MNVDSKIILVDPVEAKELSLPTSPPQGCEDWIIKREDHGQVVLQSRSTPTMKKDVEVILKGRKVKQVSPERLAELKDMRSKDAKKDDETAPPIQEGSKKPEMTREERVKAMADQILQEKKAKRKKEEEEQEAKRRKKDDEEREAKRKEAERLAKEKEEEDARR